MFKLLAVLPADRREAGHFVLIDAAGRIVHRGPCLGKADNARALAEKNPSRDPVLPYGDTPTGEYVPSPVVRFDPPHHRMGGFAILLSGAAGQALDARLAGRTGLAIHAGRGDARLVPTFGCLRLLDCDMKLVAALAGDALIETTIDLAGAAVAIAEAAS